MSAAQLMGLMFRYTKDFDLDHLIHDAVDEYYYRFGNMPIMVAVYPGTILPELSSGIEIVERKFIRPGFILVGKFEKEI
jgi:hypothetical protein